MGFIAFSIKVKLVGNWKIGYLVQNSKRLIATDKQFWIPNKCWCWLVVLYGRRFSIDIKAFLQSVFFILFMLRFDKHGLYYDTYQIYISDDKVES